MHKTLEASLHQLTLRKLTDTVATTAMDRVNPNLVRQCARDYALNDPLAAPITSAADLAIIVSSADKLRVINAALATHGQSLVVDGTNYKFQPLA